MECLHICLHISIGVGAVRPPTKDTCSFISLFEPCVQWVSHTNAQFFPACTSPTNCRRYLRYLPKAPKAFIMLCVGPDADNPLRVKISRGPFSQKHLYKQAMLQPCYKCVKEPLFFVTHHTFRKGSTPSVGVSTS